MQHLHMEKILILDEPTAGLDPNERIRFRNLISELAEERLVLLSTHIVSDVEFIANKIVLMKEGQCCFEGTSDEVIASMDKKVYCFPCSVCAALYHYTGCSFYQFAPVLLFYF